MVLVTQIERLADLGYRPTAHVLAAMLPTTEPLVAPVCEAAIWHLMPELVRKSSDAVKIERRSLQALLNSRYAWVRKEVVEALQLRGNAQYADLVRQRFRDEDEDVRIAAYEAARVLMPERLEQILEHALDDSTLETAKLAISWLESSESIDPTEFALRKIRHLRGVGASLLLERVKKQDPQRLSEALSEAAHSRSGAARSYAAHIIEEQNRAEAVPLLRILWNDELAKVRLPALRALGKLVPEERKSLAIGAFQDEDADVRRAGVFLLHGEDDPLLVEELLPLTRDEDAEVRAAALKELGKFDDPRVLAEVISARRDVNAEVVVSAENFPIEPGVASIVELINERIEGVRLWAGRIGHELLGQRVFVHQCRQGLGRTGVRKKHGLVEIEVSDSPVTYQHPHGEQIMKALALHELGHHLCDFGTRGHRTMRGIAYSEGLGHIFDVLLDERLERTLRSRRPEWGVLFDRLLSYAFAQNVHAVPLESFAKLVDQSPEQTLEAVRRGDLPGQRVDRADGSIRVGLRDSDMLKIPGLVPPFTAFLACLRCGFDPRMVPDSRIDEAIALVPSNLKDLPHSEVLEVARRIGRLLGDSRKYEEEMRGLRRRMRAHRRLLRALRQALDRLARTGQLPEWIRHEGKRIRVTPPMPKDPADKRDKDAGGQAINLGQELDFDQLRHEVTLPPNPQGHVQLLARMRKHIRRLRSYFERLGVRTREQYASRHGRRLDMAEVRRSIYARSVNLLVHTYVEVDSDVYVGILIDRSGSMEGKKIELARRFGVLIAESAKGFAGIAGHVSAFDDDTFYPLGTLDRNCIASLEAGGGNNDAGGLARAAALAQRSGKKNRLIVMISDGSPTECTVTALGNLVRKLTQEHGIRCAQIAVERLPHVTFPHHVDLSRYPMDEAVVRFGRLIMRLTADWR